MYVQSKHGGSNMNTTMRIILIVSMFTLTFSGCHHISTGNELSVPTPNLRGWEVLRMADDFATHKFITHKWEQGAGLDLIYYPHRKPIYDSDAKGWTIFYDREPSRWPGDHFTIRINDVTKEITYHGGA